MKKYTLKPMEIYFNDSFDIIVAGGGPAGCAAAIAAARKGAKTLLIEASGCLGGMGTIGLVPAWCPFTDKEKIVYKGIAEEIFLESLKGVPHNEEGRYDWVPINPEYLKKIYDEKVTGAGAEVLFNTMVSSVEAEDGNINTVIVSNKAGLSAYKAKVYIDCTGDADLAFWAGAEVIPLEENAGYQPATHCFEISNVNMKGYHEGEGLHPNNPNSPIYAILESKKYDIPDKHMCNSEIYYGTVGFNAGHIWDVDNTDPESVSKALIKGRRLAHEIHRALVDFRPDTFENSSVSHTAPAMGIRETRRILGDYVLVTADYIERKTFPDEICRNCYYLDVHRSAKEVKLVREGKADFSGFSRRYSKGESHGVPYRCLTPKGLKNVLVAGRSISTDRALQGSTRVMPVCLAMGEAAGKAAVLAISQREIDVHSIDVKELRRQIIEDGGYIK